ncbi:MAG: histidinol-phosphate aminotransferase family protein [Chloroflexi bacterium]|nr:histidinol-phosphate aminotransferase family protein [Chloroflexota bacterium]
MQESLPDINVAIDACYLSNPLATDLFWKFFNSDVQMDDQLFRRIVEAYPAQNANIAERLAPAIGVDSSRILMANGATEAIQAIIHNYASHLHVNVPTFSPYYEFATPGHQITTFQSHKEDGFALDPVQYVDSVVKSGADAAILISPNNPDGYMIPRGDLNWILDRLSYLRTIVLDESFLHFGLDAPPGVLPSLVSVTEAYPNVSIVKSMSKDFGIAGIRAGYAVMAPDRVKELLDHGYLWNINGMAEYFFLLMTRRNFITEYLGVLREYRGAVSRFTARTANADYVTAYPTSANFQLMELPPGLPADLITTLMLVRHGVYVRNCDDKIGLDGEFIRVAIRTEKENHQIISALEDVISSV